MSHSCPPLSMDSGPVSSLASAASSSMASKPRGEAGSPEVTPWVTENGLLLLLLLLFETTAWLLLPPLLLRALKLLGLLLLLLLPLLPPMGLTPGEDGLLPI